MALIPATFKEVPSTNSTVGFLDKSD